MFLTFMAVFFSSKQGLCESDKAIVVFLSIMRLIKIWMLVGFLVGDGR